MPNEAMPTGDAHWRALLDAVIPPDDARGMPGAGTLGLEAAVRGALDADATARLEALEGFADEDADRRRERLEALDQEAPRTLAGLLFHATQAYYSDARVVTALGVERHPPFPGGFELEPGDLSGLERVRAAGRRYRDA